ncbi:MAG: STAS domain-containing protein [Gloeomargaritaceae cyanobacterium C42_A2020_066]|nr:STAS domain-containing protein [Gloeomargaritaceae cyanobacterium C42_A2020_066]
MEHLVLVPATQEVFAGEPLSVPVTRLDGTVAPQIKDLCIEAVAGRPLILGIDLSRVEFMDSGGLGALLACRKHVTALGGSLGLIAPRPLILRVIEATGFDKVMPIYASRADFEASLT